MNIPKDSTLYDSLPMTLPQGHELVVAYPEMFYLGEDKAHHKLILAKPWTTAFEYSEGIATMRARAGVKRFGENFTYGDLISVIEYTENVLEHLSVMDPAWSHFRKEYTDAISYAGALVVLNKLYWVDHLQICRFMWSNARNDVHEAEIYFPRHYTKREVASDLLVVVHRMLKSGHSDDPEIVRGLQVEFISKTPVRRKPEVLQIGS